MKRVDLEVMMKHLEQAAYIAVYLSTKHDRVTEKEFVDWAKGWFQALTETKRRATPPKKRTRR